MIEPVIISKFEVTFDDGRFSDLSVGKKLGYLANYDGIDIDREIFSYGVNRCDFPELFETVLRDEVYHASLELAGIGLHRHQIDFFFCPVNDTQKAFRIGVPLKGTSGEFRAVDFEYAFVVVEWTNGQIVKSDRIVGGSTKEILAED